MVLDTSAILAILQGEPERRKFNEAIDMTYGDMECSISHNHVVVLSTEVLGP